MLTKAIVETVIDEYTAKVRIPLYNGVKDSRDYTPDINLSDATICAISNTSNIVHKGDVVYVSFEDNDTSRPVILGLLHRASESKAIDNMQDFNIRILNVNSTAKLTSDTYIGDATPNDLRNICGTSSNVQNQLNNKIDQGGTLTAPLKVTGGDSTTAGKLILSYTGKGQITDDATRTLFGFINTNNVLTVGSTSYTLNLRGNTTRPLYNGNDLALKSDLDTYSPTDELLNSSLQFKPNAGILLQSQNAQGNLGAKFNITGSLSNEEKSMWINIIDPDGTYHKYCKFMDYDGTIYSSNNRVYTTANGAVGPDNMSNKIVIRDASGHIYANWIYGGWLRSSDATDNASWTDVWVNETTNGHNGWLYKRSKASFKSDLGITTMLLDAWPIGSIYITVSTGTTGPSSPASFFGGTWERLPDGYTLWTASSGAYDGTNGIISAGLPNIAAKFYVGGNTMSSSESNRVGGAVRATGYGEVSGEKGGGGGSDNRVIFNASDGECGTSKITGSTSSPGVASEPTYSNNVYGKSSTVQPPALKVYMWRRIA